MEKWSRMNKTWSDNIYLTATNKTRGKSIFALRKLCITQDTVFFQTSESFCIITVNDEQHGITHNIFSHVAILQNKELKKALKNCF